jgi:hypothetical protein
MPGFRLNICLLPLAQLLPLIERHHLLLTTMLLFNATANETLPIFLDKMVPSAVVRTHAHINIDTITYRM